MSTKHRVAFLGAGNMTENHARNILKHTSHEIAAICSPHPDKTKKLIAKLGIDVPAYTDSTALLAQETFDVLFISIPPFAHDGQLEAAAKKGIHVFIEKPIALTRQRAQSMVDAVQEAGIIAQVGHHLRFGHAVQTLRQLIDRGETGKPVLFDGQYACNSLHTPWWRDRSQSGGQVFEQAIHLYDMAAYLMGDPQEVTGMTANLCHQDIEDYTVEDNSVASLRFKSGALGTICATNCAVPDVWHDEMTVVFENLTARFRDANQAEFIFTGESKVRKETVVGANDLYLEELQSFFSAISGQHPSPVPIEDGRRSLNMVAAVLESARQGSQPVKI